MPTIAEYFDVVGLAPPPTWRFAGFRDAYRYTWNNYFIMRQQQSPELNSSGVSALQRHIQWCAAYPEIHRAFFK